MVAPATLSALLRVPAARPGIPDAGAGFYFSPVWPKLSVKIGVVDQASEPLRWVSEEVAEIARDYQAQWQVFDLLDRYPGDPPVLDWGNT